MDRGNVPSRGDKGRRERAGAGCRNRPAGLGAGPPGWRVGWRVVQVTPEGAFRISASIVWPASCKVAVGPLRTIEVALVCARHSMEEPEETPEMSS